MKDKKHDPGRRDLLKGALAASVAASVGSVLHAEGESSSQASETGKHGNTVAAQPERIRSENAKPGTTDWRLTNVRLDRKFKNRSAGIEGYCSRTSVRAGEKLSIMVSTNPASPFKIDIYRLGYYGGTGGRLARELGPFKGTVQPEPEVGSERMRECNWEPTVTFEIPSDWTSGVYVGKLTAELDGLQSYVVFIVRDDRQCDFLLQCSDSTWQAYNRWPDRWGLYNDGSRNNWYTGPDVRVSWDRPYALSGHIRNAPETIGSGEFLLWEFPLAFWLEKEGYDVSYISNVDTHTDGAKLQRAKAFISVGHDEYWSREMYDNMLAAVAGGMNAAFFSGNTCWGLVSFTPSSAGAPHRNFSRIGQFGPLEPIALKRYPETGRFRELAPTEANLVGARNIYPYSGVQDWICADENHWIFAGTGMKNGDSIPSLVGWEWLGQPADIPGLSVVAEGEITYRNEHATYTATVYPGPKDNWVFNASTIWWSDGLSAPPGYLSPSHQFPAAVGRAPANAGPQGPNSKVQQITANILNRFCGRT